MINSAFARIKKNMNLKQNCKRLKKEKLHLRKLEIHYYTHQEETRCLFGHEHSKHCCTTIENEKNTHEFWDKQYFRDQKNISSTENHTVLPLEYQLNLKILQYRGSPGCCDPNYRWTIRSLQTFHSPLPPPPSTLIKFLHHLSFKN